MPPGGRSDVSRVQTWCWILPCWKYQRTKAWIWIDPIRTSRPPASARGRRSSGERTQAAEELAACGGGLRLAPPGWWHVLHGRVLDVSRTPGQFGDQTTHDEGSTKSGPSLSRHIALESPATRRDLRGANPSNPWARATAEACILARCIRPETVGKMESERRLSLQMRHVPAIPLRLEDLARGATDGIAITPEGGLAGKTGSFPLAAPAEPPADRVRNSGRSRQNPAQRVVNARSAVRSPPSPRRVRSTRAPAGWRAASDRRCSRPRTCGRCCSDGSRRSWRRCAGAGRSPCC